MANAIASKSNLRQICRYFSYSSLRSTDPSSHISHGVLGTLHHRPLSNSQSDFCFGHHGIRSLALLNRFLCSSAASSSVKQAESGAKVSWEAESGSGQQSGESHNTSQQGRSV